RLQQALAAGSVRQAAAAYDPRLLDDWPACAALAARGREAQALLRALDELETARRSADNGRQLVSLWGRHGTRPAGLAEAQPRRAEAEGWRARIEAYDRFKTVTLQPAASERDIADAWDRLARAGGHPDAESARPRAELARRRADLLGQLWAMPADEGED